MEVAELMSICKRGWRTILMITCLLCLVSASLEAAQSSNEDSRIVAFQSKPLQATSPATMNCLESKGAKPFKNDVLTKYGIVVLQVHSRDSIATKSLLKSCSQSESEWVELPLVRDHETYQVPTNEITVKLRDGTRAIRNLGQKYDFSVVQTTTRRDPNRFTISLDGAVAAKAQSLAEEISKSPQVEYAEVNFVVISFPIQ